MVNKPMSLETEVAGMAEALRNLVRRVDGLAESTEARLNPLWDEYQQQKGERRVIRWWLAILTVVVGIIAALHR